MLNNYQFLTGGTLNCFLKDIIKPKVFNIINNFEWLKKLFNIFNRWRIR